MAKQELLETIRDRYQAASRQEKSRIFDEFIAVTGHHRKHGIRLLGRPVGGEDQGSTCQIFTGLSSAPSGPRKPPRGARCTDEVVLEISSQPTV